MGIELDFHNQYAKTIGIQRSSKLRKVRCNVIARFGRVLQYYKLNFLTRNMKPKNVLGRFANWKYLIVTPKQVKPIPNGHYYTNIQDFIKDSNKELTL